MGLLAVLSVVAWSALAAPGQAQAAVNTAPSVSQCNPPDMPTSAGFQITCAVTVVNNTSSTGATSSTVTISACEGAAGVVFPSCPLNLGPVVSTTSSSQLVTSVNQCNGIVTGGGSNVYCDVTVTNNVPVGSTTAGVTVDQCIGSATGGGSTVRCAPNGSTTSATVTQCNGSATGGGTYAGEPTVGCTVTGATSALPVSVNQCNGTATGGGSAVTCATTVRNNFVASVPPTTTAPTVGSGTTTVPATGAGSTTVPGSGSGTTGSSGSGSSVTCTGTGTGTGSSGSGTTVPGVVPLGAPATGRGGASRTDDTTEIALGLLALAGAGGAAALAQRRRRVPAESVESSEDE